MIGFFWLSPALFWIVAEHWEAIKRFARVDPLSMNLVSMNPVDNC